MINHASKVWHGCVFAVLAALLLVMAQTANAGGTASGPGLLTPSPSPSQPAQPVDRSRLDIALDYAVADPIFQEKLQSLWVRTQTVDPGVTGIGPQYRAFASAFQTGLKLALTDFTDFSYNNVLTVVRRTLELTVLGLAGPNVASGVTFAELYTAFTVAFIYGYVWGR